MNTVYWEEYTMRAVEVYSKAFIGGNVCEGIYVRESM